MKYFLVVGEASGDLHASNLMVAIQKIDQEARFRYYGGEFMQSVGGVLLKHYRKMAFMGLIPVLFNWRTIYQNFKQCKKEIDAFRPDVVILVDYPGFNLQIARQIQVPYICYYISPKIWAWKEYRIKIIKKYIDLMFCILPFEKEFYKKYQLEVDYIGNPTVDAIENRSYKGETREEFVQLNGLEKKPIIALVAGSRKKEIERNLLSMIQASTSFDGYQSVIAGAPGIEASYYRRFIGSRPIHIVFGQTYRLLKHSQAALVTSGTATLETALLKVPQVVCYKLPFKSLCSFIFKHFFSCPYISLVNLVADKAIVKELFGASFSVLLIRNELDLLLHNASYRQRMEEGYREVKNKLGPAGASQRAAQHIYTLISTQSIQTR